MHEKMRRVNRIGVCYLLKWSVTRDTKWNVLVYVGKWRSRVECKAVH